MDAFEAKAKIDIPLKKTIIKEGEKITVTKIGNQHYLWHPDGIFTLDEAYIGEKIKLLTEEEVNEVTKE
jgi:hypothetical protein